MNIFDHLTLPEALKQCAVKTCTCGGRIWTLSDGSEVCQECSSKTAEQRYENELLSKMEDAWDVLQIRKEDRDMENANKKAVQDQKLAEYRARKKTQGFYRRDGYK